MNTVNTLNEIDRDIAGYECLMRDIENPNWDLEYSRESDDSDDDSGSGFFGTIWAFIKKIFKAIGNFFSRLFGGDDPKESEKKEEAKVDKQAKRYGNLINALKSFTVEQFKELLKTEVGTAVRPTKLDVLIQDYKNTLDQYEKINKKYREISESDKVELSASMDLSGQSLTVRTDKLGEAIKETGTIEDLGEFINNVTAHAAEYSTLEAYLKELGNTNDVDGLINVLNDRREKGTAFLRSTINVLYKSMREQVNAFKQTEKKFNELEKNLAPNMQTKQYAEYIKLAANFHRLKSSHAAYNLANLRKLYQRILQIWFSPVIIIGKPVSKTKNAKYADFDKSPDSFTTRAGRESFASLYEEEKTIANFIYSKRTGNPHSKYLKHVSSLLEDSFDNTNTVVNAIDTVTTSKVFPLSRDTYLKWHSSLNDALSILNTSIKNNEDKSSACRNAAMKLRSIGVSLPMDLSRYIADASKVCNTFASLESRNPVDSNILQYKERDNDIVSCYSTSKDKIVELNYNLSKLDTSCKTPQDAYLFKSMMHMTAVSLFTLTELSNVIKMVYDI